MNWDAIAAIAEVAGALGVIATLGYLAAQIRSNTRAMRAQSISEVTRNLKGEIDLLTQGHDVLSVLMKTEKNEDLSERDLMLADAFLTQALISRQNEYLQHRQGLLVDEVLISMQHAIRVLLSSDLARRWWRNEGKAMVAASFAEYVDQILSSQEGKHWWFSQALTQDAE